MASCCRAPFLVSPSPFFVEWQCVAGRTQLQWAAGGLPDAPALELPRSLTTTNTHARIKCTTMRMCATVGSWTGQCRLQSADVRVHSANDTRRAAVNE
jgi:hypothetical protein